MKEDTATHSSVLAGESPRTEEPGGLQSIVLQRVGHRSVTAAAAAKSLQSCPTLCDPIDGIDELHTSCDGIYRAIRRYRCVCHLCDDTDTVAVMSNMAVRCPV